MHSILWLFDTLINIYIWVLIASAVLSWLVAFNVANPRNPIVAQIGEALWRLTEPVLAPIRSFLPKLGGLDLSPLVLIIALFFIRNLLFEIFA